MEPTGLPARRAALALLQGVLIEGRSLAEQPDDTRLAPGDRARARRLCLSALRELGRADRVLSRFLKSNPAARTRAILRLGTVELAHGGAAHGVVNDWVSLAAAHRRSAGQKGLVNAVLRKVADAVADWERLPVPTLPDWLRDPLTEAWGQEVIAGIETAHLAGAPLDLTARDDPAALAEAVDGTLLPTGSVRLHDPGQVSTLPGFAEGAFWVQDAAAALPVRMLAPEPGERILDLCAAPGGKTMQLAAAGAEVTALDASAPRMDRLMENLARTRLKAEPITADAFAHDRRDYDAVLLDAPCSATGTIRRHPDLPLTAETRDIAGLIALQSRLLDHALGLLKPGGRLLFCTCSLLPDEGEVQIDEALSRHPGLTIDRTAPDRPGIAPDWIAEEGGLRLRPDYWPDLGGMDGFYAALLRKPT